MTGPVERGLHIWWNWYLRQYRIVYCGLVGALGLEPNTDMDSQGVVDEAMLNALGKDDVSLGATEPTSEQKDALKKLGTEVPDSGAGAEPV